MLEENDVNLLFRADHIKYRKAGDGKSPIGRLSIYKEYVEWRDNASPEVLTVKFIHIKGQRVSPPHKSKVQLQLVLQNEEQATFVFLNPALDKDGLTKERDTVKETLQQALIAHRAHVNQLAASVEKRSKTAELDEKQKILRENKNLEQLYKHLVATQLIPPQEFWEDYYRKEGISEEKMGINGAFLANIAQQEGTNGIKLNLNADIIQAIFTTYPAVEKKHLEMVPHEMTESEFWTKFFKSHYFHREREVLPNPKDIFADCVKIDDEEMGKIASDGIQRRRFDLNHLDDYTFREFFHKNEGAPKSAKTTLIKRCNYLSEKILATSWKEVEPSTSENLEKKKGFAVLDRVVEECEKRIESEDLAEESTNDEVQVIKIPDFVGVEVDIICGVDDIEDIDVSVGQQSNGSDSMTSVSPERWGLTAAEINELRDVNNAVNELCRHFWGCFPPTTPEAEEKLDRMEATLTKYENQYLREAERKFGIIHIEHLQEMIRRCHEKMRRAGQILRNRLALFRLPYSTEASTSAGGNIAPVLRPDLNFEFLLDDKNLELIKENIVTRKGVGDIDSVRAKWALIQAMMRSGKKPDDLTEEKYAQIWNELYDEAMLIPNMTADGVPRGGMEEARLVAEWGTKREDNCLSAEKLVQSWRSLLHPNEACGQRSYVFLGPLTSLENALLEYAYERVCALGFRPIVVPDLVSGDVTQACGVFQRSDNPIQYSLDGEANTMLSGTAEMGIAAFLRGRTFEESQLPIRLVSMSRCFRTEISKSAIEAKLYRVHEFSKVEMFSVCTPEQSDAELEFIVQVQRGTFEALGIHCRQLEMPSEELGASAAKKYDIEAWMPGRKLYGEVSSASNCTDFQTRRLGVKYKTVDGEEKFAHTCNGTALASTRALIALLETYQNEKKGLGELPEPLRHRIKQRGVPIRFQKAKPLS
ncbi:unnamed protein product [Caenorhabditis bovis]|uniref:serine--tRNA ligase n=1 Tax=Caenorhabditis bovis TaxID=2654633 RepID=A0A8S1F199_9PELO|nr:unnamed protein product [Caenorhabditis bovis]